MQGFEKCGDNEQRPHNMKDTRKGEFLVSLLLLCTVTDRTTPPLSPDRSSTTPVDLAG